MTPADAVAAMRRLIQAGAAVSLNRREIARGMKSGDNVSRTFAPHAEADLDRLASADLAGMDALSALAGMCVLDVEVVRALLGMATVESGDDCIAREAAEAELRRVVP